MPGVSIFLYPLKQKETQALRLYIKWGYTKYYYFIAIVSISIRAPSGKSFTANAARAGCFSV